MSEDVRMIVKNNETDEIEDFGYYPTLKEALLDLINYDIPRGRYGVIECEEFMGEIDTIDEAEEILKKVISE